MLKIDLCLQCGEIPIFCMLCVCSFFVFVEQIGPGSRARTKRNVCASFVFVFVFVFVNRLDRPNNVAKSDHSNSTQENKEVTSKLRNFLEGADISINAVEAESKTSSFGNDDNEIQRNLECESALFSDFKIVIITHPDEAEVSPLQRKQSLNLLRKRFTTLKETVYFVHKFGNAGGQHKSEYFSNYLLLV